MKSTIIIILLLFLPTGNQFVSSQSKTGDLPVLDISKQYPKKQLFLQDIAEIENVRLETSDSVLLSGVGLRDISMLASVSDKYIVVYDLRRGDIFIFNRNGTIFSHFNHKGSSSREYPLIEDSSGILFDEKNEEIFVCSYRAIQVYSLYGDYKRTLKLEIHPKYFYEICNFDDETLLLYKDLDVEYVDDANTEKLPYSLISKKDGSTVSVLYFYLPKRYSTRYRKYSGDGGKSTIWKSSNFSNRYHGQNLLLADISSDTMYLLNQNRELTPLLVRKPSVHASEPRKVWTITIITDKFVSIHIKTLDFEKDSSPRMQSFVYEFETGEISDMLIKNTDFNVRGAGWSGPTNPINSPENTTARLLQVPQLKEYANRKILVGDFEKFVATLDYDDNPIVQIIKFK